MKAARLGVVLLHPLLVFFAADAERRLRSRFEALDRDLFAALFTDAEASVLDLAERLLDLVEEHLLAPAEAERERLKVLARSEVHLIREIVGVEGHVLLERLLRLLHDLVTLLREKRLELLQLDLVHPPASGVSLALRSSGA